MEGTRPPRAPVSAKAREVARSHGPRWKTVGELAKLASWNPPASGPMPELKRTSRARRRTPGRMQGQPVDSGSRDSKGWTIH